MTIDYKIRFEHGGVTITQHVATDGTAVPASVQQAASVPTLGDSRSATEKAAAAKAGGNAPLDNPPDDGGNAPLDNPPDDGGNAPGQGQIVVFGPVVIDAAGLMHRCHPDKSSAPKEGDK